MVKKTVAFELEVYEDDLPALEKNRVLLEAYVCKGKKIPPVLIERIASIFDAPNRDFKALAADKIRKAHYDSFKHFKDNPDYDFIVKKKLGKKHKTVPAFHNKIILTNPSDPFNQPIFYGNKPLTNIFYRVIVEFQKQKIKNPDKLKKHTDEIRFLFLKFREIINGDEYKQKVSVYGLTAMAGSVAFAFGWRYNNDEETDIETLFKNAYYSANSVVKKQTKKPNIKR
jgi:hypothetical protein